MEKRLFKVFEPYFKIGAAVNKETIKTHADFIKEHFNLLVCENEMKFSYVVNENGEYDFTEADRIYNFAQENAMDIHTHTFVWHWETRDFEFDGDREAVLDGVARHMKRFNEHFPKLTTVDVINEAIDDKHGLFLRESKWLEKLGENYIFDIYRLARETNPNWRLIYNDYNECVPEKREKVIKLAGMLKSEGLIDGVGLQSHLNIMSPSEDEIKRCFDDFSKLGLPLRISELDVSMFGFNDETELEVIPKEMYIAQAKMYAAYLKECIRYHEIVDSVTFWGTTDDKSWLNYCPKKRNNPGLLFDKDCNPKEAFYAVCDLV